MQIHSVNNESVDVIVLDINIRRKQYDDYKKLSAENKIIKITNLIVEAMEKFTAEQDSRMKIFVCREYSITDPESKFCENDTRKLLKEKMSLLTKTYPTLCIISGTIATCKNFNKLIDEKKHEANIKKTEEAYKHLGFFNDEISDHRHQWHKVMNQNNVNIVRNTCYVFQGDKILRHDKVIPFKDTRSSSQNNVAFRPGRGETANPIKSLIHPGTNKPIYIGIEICAEHGDGYLIKMLLDKNKNEQSKIELAIHFVLSDSIMSEKNRICSDCFIHVDSKNKLEIINKPESSGSLAINPYLINVLDSSFLLKKPGEDTFETDYLFDFLDKCILGLNNQITKNNTYENSYRSLLKYFLDFKKKFTEINSNQPEDFRIVSEKYVNMLEEPHMHYGEDMYVRQLERIKDNIMWPISWELSRPSPQDKSMLNTDNTENERKGFGGL